MEVAVITRHAIANYGSLLQAAATQNALETLGHNCRIIDYVRPGEVCRNDRVRLASLPAEIVFALSGGIRRPAIFAPTPSHVAHAVPVRVARGDLVNRAHAREADMNALL